MTRQQHFGWFLSRGFGPQGWARSYHEWNYAWQKPDLYQQSARELEQAGFDFVLIEDALSVGITPETLNLRVRKAYGGPKHDPWTLAPYLFAATRHLGVIPTVNAGAYPPYLAARQFASLQHLSSSRLGLNVVTDVGSAHHFGAERLPHDEAYDRAQEWLDALNLLWHSWGDEALIANPRTQVYADGTKITAVQHRGRYFSFDGPLNAEPLPHGDPVVASPGGSPRGIDFAGRNSQIQLALSNLDVESVRSYRTKVQTAAAAHGRDVSDIKVLFVFKPIVAASREEADRIVEASAHPTDAALLEVAEAWSSDLETDLTALDLDRPLNPDEVFGQHVSQGTIKGLRGRFDSFDGVPLREILAGKARLGRIGDGISGTVGTADELADLIEALGDDAGNDGLIFSGDLHPVTLHRALDDLVPILRRRGILRSEFVDGGLRPNLSAF
ncbi:LLM class flavin-dependent oxidoreductase [Microbacterium trichothecenolyticum]|uniref:LLM class flavin-dependent oxidoreductase n=1 Tax=Microbacterium ureisolvens TaxID=2781186 RepID=A0ABS7HUD5_9MICO|nr:MULTISPECIES: LLM class flavin-dependent oxidoreductase [Microbacterium]MBW9108969.1 LLM class flavin-dependent oxidoreductase [Microbacterium ureisolvens]MBW9119907.1 LLM class flavin-dependent oxidoreductase [Microbacterium trichothecenolyticum]